MQASTGQTKQATGTESWLQRHWREQPAFILSLVYLVLGVAGSFFYYQLFNRFGINIFYYADVSDFLLVIFREPLIPALTLAAILCLYMIARVDGWLDARFPAYRQWSARFDRRTREGQRSYLPVWEGVIALVVFLFVRFITPFSVDYAMREIRQGRRQEFLVVLNGETAARPSLPPGMRVIGTTSRYVFLYDPTSRLTHIVPLESITQMTLLPPDDENN